MASSVLQVRVEESVRKEAEEIFHNLGLNLSSAVKLFLNRVIVEQGLPFKMTLEKQDLKKKEESNFDPVLFLNDYIEKNNLSGGQSRELYTMP